MSNKKFKAKFIFLSLIGSVFALSSANAATQGTLGLTSTGSANISVTKSVQAQISDLTDMTLSNWSIGQGAVTLYSNVCIYSSTGSYKVTASGDGLLNAFTIGTGLNLIPYSVKWNSAGAGSLDNTGSSLLSSIQSSSFNNANTSSANCSGGGVANDTARVVISISALAMDAAASSNTPYTGTLTMLITPY